MYPIADYPDISINDAIMRYNYNGLIQGNMEFEVSTTNTALQDEWFNGSTSETILVDRSTGKDTEDGYQTSMFVDTIGWANGALTSIFEEFRYADTLSDTKRWKVNGNQITYSVPYGSYVENIPIWELIIDDFEQKWTDGNFDYKYSYSNFIWKRTAINGVALEKSMTIKFWFNDAGSTTLFQAWSYSWSRIVIEVSKGIDILETISTTSPTVTSMLNSSETENTGKNTDKNFLPIFQIFTLTGSFVFILTINRKRTKSIDCKN